ncbi:MAG TPA: response regulator [Candidatus Angelobacter sp.]|nr:response regulator [Candidatus Angelobacter sp.]
MKKLRILLGGNESIESAMESWGFDVTAVADGKQVCSAIYTDRFDLCLLDWDLPKMTGLEACGWIRSVNLPAQPYVVLVTHRGNPEQVHAAYLTGANDFITSPFNLEDLHFLVSAFAHKLSRARVAFQDLGLWDPLEQYRRDLSSQPTRIYSRI